eukprot:1742096-Amphidinium_carterae.1
MRVAAVPSRPIGPDSVHATLHDRQAKRTHPSHGLLEGAEAFSLHRVPPGSPLSVNPEISSGDPHRWQETGTPGPVESVLCVSAIANNHRFLGGKLHVGLPPVTMSEHYVTVSEH